MNFIIKKYSDYKKEEVLALYESVGWSNYTNRPDMLSQAFQHSLVIYGAYDQEKLIGLIRMVGDGYSVILFQDILILPQYQGMGVGTTLVNYVLNEYEDVYQKLLFIFIFSNFDYSIKLFSLILSIKIFIILVFPNL